MVGEGLEERPELEMRSEGIRWPLCDELLQLVSDGFGGHRGSCRLCDDQRSFKLLQNGGPVHVRNSFVASPATGEMKRNLTGEN